ncbi:MAG TPA: peptidoglycan DD-metalloendopeptidase family protein [Phnomibacter sp.]|nr:peptidoglycan DD-metalloendopeptidase family protein [Phnomibacter sp.]
MNRILLSLFCSTLFFFASAQQPQSKEDLQRKTQQLLKEIENVKTDLAETQKNKKQTLGVLRNIEKKIDIRNQVIQNIKGEVYLVEKDIIKTYREIDTLKMELATLKSQYAQSVVYAYKNRSNYDFLNFLFSAGSFGDALKRVSYLKTYRSYRAQKAGDIVSTQAVLEAKIASLGGKRLEKTKALDLEGKQKTELEVEKKEKDKVIAEISSQEKQLRKSLANREKERKQLKNAIAAVIKREKDEAIKRDREEAARKKAEAAKNANAGATAGTKPANTGSAPTGTTPKTVKKREESVLENTPEGLIRSQEFEGNRGSLPWPVSKGVITLHYGPNRIPTNNKPIDVVEPGITIETTLGAPVKAIFDGEVRSIFNIGGSQSVMLIHGKYFSTYSNLQGVSVTKGQKVTAGQVLGKAGANDDGVGEISLQLDNEKGTMNPELWIRK